MANAVYQKGLQKFANGSISWLSDDIKCWLVDTADYGVSISVDEFCDTVYTAVAAATVAVSANFAQKTCALGVLDASNITFSSVTGDECEALVIFKDSGDFTTSPLLFYIDSATGLAVTPNGGDIEVQWDSGANKIAKL